MSTEPLPVQTIAPTFRRRLDAATVAETQSAKARREQELAQNHPESVERYKNEEQIGQGAMGSVYRVLDQDLNRNIAMKVLLSLPEDQEALEGFVAEAQISGQLEHPSLLPIHDIGINAEGKAYFTMRYVPEHVTLFEIIHKLRMGDSETHEKFSIERRVQIIQRVCDALTYAHKRGVIHRDIKPSNIIIGPDGEIYLADWGVAALMQNRDQQQAVSTSGPDRPIQEGDLVGTPLYMSPEQLLGQADLGPASDVYSLCAVAYEFFTTVHYLGPDRPDEYMQILDTVVNTERVDAENYADPLGNRAPRPISRILRKGLSKRHEERIENAAELEAGLQNWAEGNAPVVCPGTFIQHWLVRYSKAIDKRPVLMPAITWALVAVFFAINAAALWTLLA